MELDVDTFRKVLEANLVGTFLGIQSVIEPMRARGGGSIVNLSSPQGLEGRDGFAAYASSKFGVRGLTKCAAIELGPFGIRVNTVVAGPHPHRDDRTTRAGPTPTTTPRTACTRSGAWPSPRRSPPCADSWWATRRRSAPAPTSWSTAASRPASRGRRGEHADPADRFDVRGRVAIVTGGGRGIGRALSEGLAAAGAPVVVASRSRDVCEETVATIEAAGGTALARRGRRDGARGTRRARRRDHRRVRPPRHPREQRGDPQAAPHREGHRRRVRRDLPREREGSGVPRHSARCRISRPTAAVRS